MHVNLRMPDSLLAEVKRRGDLSESLREGLARYYHLLERARASLREVLTDEELRMLADVNNGTLWEPHMLCLIALNAQDAEDGYYTKWGVKRSTLLKRLQALTPLECAALVDAIERFWRAAGTGMPVDPARLLDEPRGEQQKGGE